MAQSAGRRVGFKLGSCHHPLGCDGMETRRKGHFDEMFDEHDIHWLTEFSLQNPEAFGYAVTVDFRRTSRLVHCAKVSRGTVRVKRSLARNRG